MARPSLATVADLNEALDTPVTNETQAQTLLDRASAIVRAYAHTTWLNDTGAELANVPDDIPGVVVSMVERASRNPTGTTQEQAGPFMRSFGAEASNRLYLTKWERMVISEAAGNVTGVGTISTTRGPLETACPVGGDLYPEEVLETIPWPS